MKVLRRILLSFCSVLLGLSLIGLAWSHSLSATLRDQEVVKSWLVESGFYDELSSSVVDQVAQNSNENVANVIENEEVQQIATDALDSTNVLQGSVEQLLGSVYSWLDGGELPTTLSVDFAEASQQLSGGLGNYAATRAASLPECTQQQTMLLQASYDVWTAPCRPAQLSATQIGETARAEILSSIGTGETDVPTSEVFNPENQEQLEQVRTAYQRSRWLPYLFALLAIVSGAGLVFASSEQRKGLNRVGWITIVSGILVGLSALSISKGPTLARSAFKNTNQEQSTIDLVARIIETAGQDVSRILWRYGALYIALGLIATVVAMKVMQQSKASSSDNDPTPPPANPPMSSSSSSNPVTEKPKENTPTPRPPRKIQL